MRSEKPRPKLNLALVLDRSGSMGGEKLHAAKKAAKFAVRQLRADDRVAVTLFDDEVENLFPSTLARDKEALVAKIRNVECGGSTALHDGWVEGASQVAAHLENGGLNRVLLLTDGQANHGETNPGRICADVKGLAARGVSTSTLGVGDDFNEDLLQQMAGAGDGNYYFIEGASDLERLFAAELSGLMATLGRKVSLGIEPQNGAVVSDVLSDLEKTECKRLMLANLIAGNTLEVVFKLCVPALESAAACFLRLAFDGEDGRRVVLREALSLRGVPSAEWENLSTNSVVTDAATRLEMARKRLEIARHLDAGDMASARATHSSTRDLMRARLSSPLMVAEESADLDALAVEMEAGNSRKASKMSKYTTYARRRSQ